MHRWPIMFQWVDTGTCQRPWLSLWVILKQVINHGSSNLTDFQTYFVNFFIVFIMQWIKCDILDLPMRICMHGHSRVILSGRSSCQSLRPTCTLWLRSDGPGVIVTTYKRAEAPYAQLFIGKHDQHVIFSMNSSLIDILIRWLIRCANIKSIWLVLWKIQNRHDLIYRWTDRQTDGRTDGQSETSIPPSTPLLWVQKR